MVKLLDSANYQFLKTNPRLGNRIILMGIGGSYAYGTNNENSDIDFRGITLNLPSDLLGLTTFEQYEDESTDTVIYYCFRVLDMEIFRKKIRHFRRIFMTCYLNMSFD